MSAPAPWARNLARSLRRGAWVMRSKRRDLERRFRR